MIASQQIGKAFGEILKFRLLNERSETVNQNLRFYHFCKLHLI